MTIATTIRSASIAQPKSDFRSILQNLVCDRYADRDAALAAIDVSYQAGRLSQVEQRKLEARVG